MKAFIRSLLFASVLVPSLAFVAAGARADAPDPASAPPQDQVRLKDGRVVSGQIVEEGSGGVVVVVDGVRRTYDRSFVAGVAYGGAQDSAAGRMDAPAVPEGTYAPAPSDAEDVSGPASQPAASQIPASALVADVSNRYQVPPRDVRWVLDQGVAPADVPLVFLIAATARVTPRQVLALRAEGYDWGQIERYYQMRPDAIDYEPGPLLAYPVYEPDWLWWDWDGCYGCWGWPVVGAYWGGGYGWGRGWYGRGAWGHGWNGHAWSGGARGAWSGAGRGWSGAGRSWSGAGGRGWSGAGRSSGGFSGGHTSAGGGGGHR